MSDRLSNQQPIRALVVDDDLDSIILLTTMLEIYGIDVTSATCAAQAMQKMRSHPDILISDLAMPLVDGFDLIKQVRALPQEQGGEIPAIAISAWVAIEAQERASECGFQEFLSKPYHPNELIDLVGQLTGYKVAEFAA